MICALLIGTILYMVTISSYIVKICVHIIKQLKKVVKPIIRTFDQLLDKLFKTFGKYIIQPLYIYFKRFKANSAKKVIKSKKVHKKEKNCI